MKNLLLNSQIFPLASEKEKSLFENAMKIDLSWHVNSVHRKGDFIILCSYNYAEWLEVFDTPKIKDIERGNVFIYSIKEKRIIDLMIIAENILEAEYVERNLIHRVNALIKEEEKSIT